MQPTRMGFIGFGEVAATFSAALRQHGADVAVYDILLDRKNGAEILRKRTRTGGIRFLPLPELVASADCVLSTVTTNVAAAAARAAAVHLKPGQTYLDLNATAPTVKSEIARIVEPTGAHFVEGAILGAVGVTGARTRILTGGAKGPATAKTLARLGLNAAFYSREIGRASTFKMLRSVFSKGLEALLLEFLIAGKRAGMQDDLWREVLDLFSRNPFERVAANWIQTHPAAHERRYHEMVQVASVVRELGLDPILTAATATFFNRSRTLGLKEAFPEKPGTPDQIIAVMETRLARPASSLSDLRSSRLLKAKPPQD